MPPFQAAVRAMKIGLRGSGATGADGLEDPPSRGDQYGRPRSPDPRGLALRANEGRRGFDPFAWAFLKISLAAIGYGGFALTSLEHAAVISVRRTPANNVR
jgi:hypothetical protein